MLPAMLLTIQLRTNAYAAQLKPLSRSWPLSAYCFRRLQSLVTVWVRRSQPLSKQTVVIWVKRCAMWPFQLVYFKQRVRNCVIDDIMIIIATALNLPMITTTKNKTLTINVLRVMYCFPFLQVSLSGWRQLACQYVTSASRPNGWVPYMYVQFDYVALSYASQCYPYRFDRLGLFL